MASKLAQFMAQTTRAQQPKTSPTQEKTVNVHALYKQGLRQIRTDRNMAPERKKVEAARLYRSTRGTLAKLKAQQKAQDDEQFPKLERKLWGHDLDRATAVDRASIDATIRDANDRAARIKRQDDAHAALAQAERDGDHILAKAVAKRAHDLDWGEVVADYLATRPSAADTYQQLGDIWHRNNGASGRGLRHSMDYVVHKPDELAGLTDADVDALGADPAADAA